MSGPRESQVSWKPEWTEALRGYVVVKGLSASMAAAEVNADFGTRFSRNAIISKAGREGIPLRASKGGGRRGPHGGPSQRKPRVRASTKKVRPAASPHPGPKLPTSAEELRCDDVRADRRVSLLGLTENTCRWPISTVGAPDFCFCGNPPVEGLPYCPGHSRLAYRSFDPRPQSTFRPMGRA